MQSDKVRIYLHLVWSTWDRLPLIAHEDEEKLHDCIAAIAVKQKCSVIAIGGMPDHVHLLLQFPATLNVGFLMQQLKGGSAHFANQEMELPAPLKWRGSYAAFSVSRWDVAKIAAYIRDQKVHHAQNGTIAQLEVSGE